jgi:hypothetical protein
MKFDDTTKRTVLMIKIDRLWPIPLIGNIVNFNVSLNISKFRTPEC